MSPVVQELLSVHNCHHLFLQLFRLVPNFKSYRTTRWLGDKVVWDTLQTSTSLRTLSPSITLRDSIYPIYRRTYSLLNPRIPKNLTPRVGLLKNIFLENPFNTTISLTSPSQNRHWLSRTSQRTNVIIKVLTSQPGSRRRVRTLRSWIPPVLPT